MTTQGVTWLSLDCSLRIFLSIRIAEWFQTVALIVRRFFIAVGAMVCVLRGYDSQETEARHHVHKITLRQQS